MSEYRSYNVGCELNRMTEIFAYLRQEYPVTNSIHIIRYNPDAYKVDGVTTRTTKSIRHYKLLEMLKRKVPDKSDCVSYMFYDMQDGKVSITNHIEYDINFKNYIRYVVY